MRIKSVGGKHLVKAGETLISISQQYGVTIGSIMAPSPSIDWPNARNNGDVVFVGEVLALPKGGQDALLPTDPSASTYMFQFSSSNEIREMMGRGGAKGGGAIEVDAISGAAVIAEGFQWKDFMPSTLYSDGSILVVCNTSMRYVNIRSKDLKSQFFKELYRDTPLGLFLPFQVILGELVFLG